MLMVALISILTLAIAAYYLWPKRNAASAPSNSISSPPLPPEVTPTIVSRGVIVGSGTYFDTSAPETIVDVISVGDHNYVKYQLMNGAVCYLPVEDFLVRYAPRQVTRISDLK